MAYSLGLDRQIQALTAGSPNPAGVNRGHNFHIENCCPSPHLTEGQVVVEYRRAPPSSRGLGHRPFKPETRVRFPLGAPQRIHPEPHSLAVEQFLAMVRFEQRGKLAELPDDLVGGRDVFV
jgi:hypothetical protein